jgi:hypothetical protein
VGRPPGLTPEQRTRMVGRAARDGWHLYERCACAEPEPAYAGGDGWHANVCLRCRRARKPTGRR